MDEYQALLKKALAQGLDKTDHATLLQLRKLAETHGDALDQETLAPLEHQAFSKEYVADHPSAAPSMVAAPFAYYLAKSLRAQPARTKPSKDQVLGGIRGVELGLRDWINKR